MGAHAPGFHLRRDDPRRLVLRVRPLVARRVMRVRLVVRLVPLVLVLVLLLVAAILIPSLSW